MLAATSDSKECQPCTSSSIEWSQPCRHFEFPEILLATYNFDESLVIGHGGFGKVYKGNIINGSSVAIAAIKQLDSMSSQGETEFWTEVEMLSKLRHCHLVSLLGYCNHEKEMILIYEYMPSGTLEDHLHKLGTPLSWLQRLKICIGTARGLDYLHTGTGIEFGVIHRDVKSSNILLHEGWAAKISDFGLSRIGATNQPITYVNTLVKGTFGYLDPNYFSTGKLTRKSDVYAFGVVLLEMLCRKRAVDRSLDEEQWGLVTWVQESITKGNLKNIIDSGIRGEISPKCLKEFVQIAERCVHNNPKQRPTMAEVAVTLDSILTLQQKINISLQAAGKTIFGRMLDKFSFTSNGEKPAHDDTKSSITTEDNSKTAGNNKKLEDNSKYAGDAVGGDNKKLTSLIINPSLKIFKFADLESITRNFSQDLLIDRDGYGEVFIGWVDDKTFAPSTKGVGIVVAVKRYNEGLPESETPAARLGWLAHPNVTSLLGYCDDHKHSCLLVYEHMHMENRNFSHFLFGDVDEPLSWGTRLLILLGVARGLAYVHSSKENVIHGGIKTFNILLDQNFNAKMGHFGLAVQPKTRELNATTRDMDTMRYFDQWDLNFSGVFTTKSDVYSFGVVLLETITGQRVWEPKSLPSLFNLKNWSRPFLADKSKLKDIIDPRLEQNYPLEGAFECLALATRCLASDAKGSIGICHLAQAVKGDSEVLLKGVGERGPNEEVKHIIEMAKRASLRREVLHTDFLTPPVLKEAMVMLEKLADVKVLSQGGYPEAERCRLSVGHPEALITDPDIVAALSISGNFGFQPCSHGDFLGSILGTGIVRDKLGDILLQGEKGAHVLVVPELVDFLTMSLEKVGNVPVTCKKMPLIALEYEPPRTKAFKTVEASMRLDAIASAGYKISRSKLVGLISDGDVRVNWVTVTKNNTTIRSGDMISVSGKGRLKIGEVSETKKGKFAVELIRFL